MSRLNNIVAIVGRKGSGKTTTARHLMSRNGKKSLVFDTFDHPSYRDIGIIETKDLKRWTGGNARLISGEVEENLIAIAKEVYNTLIVLEDAAKYFNSQVTRDLKPLFVDSKQHNNDIIIMFHRLSEIPPYLLSFIDFIVIHKTNENKIRASRKFSDDEAVLSILKDVESDKNPFFSLVLPVN